MKYKAIISDVDGTLMKQGSTGTMQGFPTKRVSDAIARIKDRIHFGIATSRPLSYTTYIFDHLSLSGPCIIFGGSLIVDPQSKKVLWEKNIDKDAASEVLRIVDTYRIDFVLHESDGRKITSTNGYTPALPRNIFLSELTEEKASKVHEVLRKIPTIAFNKTASWTNNLCAFDVTHIEATKQHGVLQVAEILGIHTDEIIGVGDGYNDFPLLMACGFKVAMGNAVEDLKAIADYVAPRVDEDGLADVIEKFILS